MLAEGLHLLRAGTVDGWRPPEAALRPQGPHGLLMADIPAGEHRVLLREGGTSLRTGGKAITLACLGLAPLTLAIPARRCPAWQQPRPLV
jgi:hypothetical protein